MFGPVSEVSAGELDRRPSLPARGLVVINNGRGWFDYREMPSAGPLRFAKETRQTQLMLPQPINPAELDWITRPHERDEPARHVVELSDAASFGHVRGNVWRYEPGANGRRHSHPVQEETFVVLDGTLSMYVGDPPERRDIEAGSLIHVLPGTPLQSVNHGTTDLIVYAYGYPPEEENAELLDSAI